MKPVTRYTLTGLAALLLVLSAALGWLLGTTSGARWVLERFSRVGPLTIETESVEGRLWGHLRIQGLRAAWPDGYAAIRKFELNWQPARLLIGQLGLNELTAAGVRVRDNRPEAPPGGPGFTWPALDFGITPLFVIRIQSLVLDDAEYRRGDQAPVRIGHAEAGVRISGAAISFMNMSLEMTPYHISGTVIAGLKQPSLRMNLSVASEKTLRPGIDMDGISIRTDLAPAEAPAQLEGTIQAAGHSGPQTVIEIRGSIALTTTAVLIRSMQAKQPGRNGSLTAQGTFFFAAERPALEAKLFLHGLDLSNEIPHLPALGGELTIRGSASDYEGSVSVVAEGTGWKAGSIAADFRGTAVSLQLDKIRGSWLEGTAEGSARADWKKTASFSASLNARGLNPALFDPAWNGAVNFNIVAAARLPAKRHPAGSLSLRLLQSTIRGRPLTGSLDARMKNGDIGIEKLELAGKGFKARANGELSARLNFAVSLPDLSLLKPGTEGRAEINGWIRKKKGLFAGSISAGGRRISLGGITAGRAELKARIEDRKDPAFSLTVSLRNGAYNFIHLDSLALDGSGTLSDHVVRASLRSSNSAIAARVAGSYDGEAWQGTIVHLSGSDERGIWKAAAPARIDVSVDRFSLSPLALTGAADERVELQAAITRTPLSGVFSVDWKNLDISRANRWITGMTLSGLLNGQVRGKILPEGLLDLDAGASLSQADISRRIQDVEFRVELKKAEIAASWRGESIEAALSLTFADYGRIDASLRAPIPARLPVSADSTSPLSGEIAGAVREIGALSFLFPGLIQESRGRLAVDIRINGTWGSPNLTGSLRLDDAGGFFPAAGVRVSDIRMDARIEGNVLRIASFSAASGPGKVRGTAAISLQGLRPARYEGSLEGERFQALLLPQVRMQISPRITFTGTPQLLSVRGEVALPELLVYGAPRDAPVEASADVVIAGAPEEDTAARMKMDIEVNVVLGDRVIVKTGGVDAQLGGRVVLAARSLAEVTGKGEIRVTRGKYSIYGVSLDIERGRLLFPGGAVDNPTLDILAARTVNQVKAGVLVSGTLKTPKVKLYSEPAMPDADVLAYIVLGRPLGQDKEQETLLMRAAAALLSRGESAALQDQIKNRLGVDTIDIEAGEGDVARSLVTIGKYLSSRLYISYGYALFSGEGLFRMRYRFGKRWELESRSGETSGVDLYYTIQFD